MELCKVCGAYWEGEHYPKIVSVEQRGKDEYVLVTLDLPAWPWRLLAPNKMPIGRRIVSPAKLAATHHEKTDG